LGEQGTMRARIRSADARIRREHDTGSMSAYHFDYRPPPKNVKPTGRDFARIARYLLPAWRPSTLILICILVTALLGLIPPLLIREIIDSAIPRHDRSLLNWLIAGMIGAPLISGLIGVWMNYLV